MTEFKTLYKNTSLGQLQSWQIVVEGNTYYTSLPSKEYSYTTKEGVTIKANDWLTVVFSAFKLGHKIHWSQSKQQFYDIAQMDSQHILNTINLYMDENDMTPQQFAEFVQNSPYIKELVTRYPV